MSPRAAVFLLALLVPALWAATTAVPTHAAELDQFSIVDSSGEEDAPATGVPLARLQAPAVEKLVEADSDIRSIRSNRPGARLVMRFDPAERTWSATLREYGAKVDLAKYTVDDVSGRITDRWILPVGQYPSRLSQQGAIDIAVLDRDARREAKRWGGMDELYASARLVNGTWEVDLKDPDRRGAERNDPVIRVDVRDVTATVEGVWTGIQIPWKMARGDRGAFGGDINQPVLWYAFFALFLLVAVDWRRWRTLFTADIAALLLLGVSLEFFLHGEIDWSTPLAFPPLLWLTARAWWIFHRGLPAQPVARVPRSRVGRLVTRRVPTIAIVILCVALAGLRIGVTLDGGNVIDVGAAGVIGARAELDGGGPWGKMPDNNPHGDTYGPLNYLAYVPATAALSDDEPGAHDGTLPAAKWTSIWSDLLCAALLALIGWRWISRRAAALLAAGWFACPWTVWALASGVNDALLAAVVLAAFASLKVSTLRGFFIGAAAMVKFAPLAVVPIVLHAGGTRRLRQSVLTLAGFAVAIAAGLAWVVFRIHGAGSPLDDLHLFWERTIEFQADRGSPFSIWGLYEWKTAQRIAQALVVLGILIAVVLPRQRSAWQIAAGIGGTLLAAQLVLTHWFYLYVPWAVGFLLLVLVAARERPDTPDMLAE